MSESTPFFSICVPTRNRPETLYYCLKTLLDQSFDSYEIIVSDNCDAEDSEKTFTIVKELDSPRIKYYKQEVILSMTANYEFALSKATGKFITCMGDDDGLVADSLQYVYDFILHYNAKVVKCAEINYWWIGSHLFPDSALSYPTERPVMQIQSKSILEKVAGFELGYFVLPMLYYSFISRDIIEEVVSEKGNFFQNSASIDMYSGFIIAHKTESFFVTDKPFAISGQSRKSNGATVISTYDNKISQEYLAQHSLIQIYDRYKVPFLDKFHMGMFVWLELSKFVENFKVSEQHLQLNYRNILIDMLSDSPDLHNLENHPYAGYFNKYSIYENDLKFIGENFFNKQLYYPKLGNYNTAIGQHVFIDPLKFGARDVYGASLLCRQFIQSRQIQLPLKLQPENINTKGISLSKKISIRLSRTWKVLTTGSV